MIHPGPADAFTVAQVAIGLLPQQLSDAIRAHGIVQKTGNVSQQVRAIHPYLGIDSLPAVNHQPEFADAAATPAADRAVRDGAVLLAQTVVELLSR